MTDPQRGSTGVQFARPLGPDGARQHVTGGAATLMRPGSTLAIGGLVVLACATFLLQTRTDSAQNLPASAVKQSKVTRTSRVRVAMAEHNVAPKQQDVTRPSLDFYTKGVRGSLFSAPVPAPPKAAPVAKLPRVIVPPSKPVFVDPFADWTYAGSVTVGDKKMALLENRTTKEGQYVLEGQPFMGLANVKSVTDQMVTLVSAGKPTILAKSDAMNVTPLSASAAYLTAQPQQAAQANAQQMMAAMQAGQMGSGAPGMVLPNGRVLTAEQMARFNSRMNRRFDGGQGGAGGQNQWQGGRGGRGGGPGAPAGAGGFGGGRRGGRGGQGPAVAVPLGG